MRLAYNRLDSQVARWSAEMSEFEHAVLIDRPVAEVFAFVTDPANNPSWMPFAVEVAVMTGGPVRVGTRVRQSNGFLGRRFDTIFEVTELEPDRRCAIRFLAGPVWGTSVYSLAPAGGGTGLVVEMDIEAHRFFRMAEPVFAGVAQLELSAAAKRLKELLEGAPAAREALLVR
jgi:uncharacterized protein YndB with AHSA1/START domain